MSSRHRVRHAGAVSLGGIGACVVAGLVLTLGGPFAGAQAKVSTVSPAVAKQMREALESAQRGHLQQALQTVDSLLQQQPRFVPALKLQGMLLEDSGNDPAAFEAYRKALKLDPNDPDLLIKVGVVDLVKGDTDEAIALLGQRARALPKDEESFYYLAQAYHRKGNDELALKIIRKASQLAPESAPIAQKYGELLCSSGDNVEALRWLNKARQADPALGRIDFDLAVASYNNMDLDGAVTYASRETQAQPGDLDAFALLAAAKVKLAQWADAQTALQRVLAVRKDDASLLLELGHCELELRTYQAAVDTLQRSLQVDPTQAQAHFFLSRAYAGLGLAEDARHEAELHQRMMQEISFEVPKAQQKQQAELAAQARGLLAAHREEEALRLFAEDVKQPHGTPAAPAVSVGATYLAMGDAEAARRTLEHALQADAKVKGAHTYLGILALQQEDLARADHEFQAELTVDANHPLALAELGEVRYRQARWADAADLIAKSKTTIPRFLYMLTDAYFHLGKVAAANLTAESLAAYARNQPEVMRGLVDLLTRNGQSALAQRLQQS